MTPQEYLHLRETVNKYSIAADVLSRTLLLLLKDESDVHWHSVMMRWHRAAGDCSLGLRHALDSMPASIPG
jgi:hypothetical protein